jgi:hypothetical protein
MDDMIISDDAAVYYMDHINHRLFIEPASIDAGVRIHIKGIKSLPI